MTVRTLDLDTVRDDFASLHVEDDLPNSTVRLSLGTGRPVYLDVDRATALRDYLDRWLSNRPEREIQDGDRVRLLGPWGGPATVILADQDTVYLRLDTGAHGAFGRDRVEPLDES